MWGFELLESHAFSARFDEIDQMNEAVPSSKKLYVLIKWRNDDGATSFGVIRNHWIRGFNLKEFWQRAGPKIYLVDWKCGDDQRVFKAEVLDVNETKAPLKEKQIKLADEELFRNKRKRRYEETLTSSESLDSEQKEDCKVKPNSKDVGKTTFFDKMKVLTEEFTRDTYKEAEAKVIELQNRVIELQTRVHEKDMECLALKNKVESLQMLISNEPKENSNELSGLKEQITRLSDVVTGKIDEITLLYQSSTPTPNEKPNVSAKQVEIFEGSRVYCSEMDWVKANIESKPSLFVRKLLVAVFDVDTLRRSSIAGRSQWNNKESALRPPLDPRKYSAIALATHKKFPGTEKSLIYQTIATKLAQVRTLSNKAEPK